VRDTDKRIGDQRPAHHPDHPSPGRAGSVEAVWQSSGERSEWAQASGAVGHAVALHVASTTETRTARNHRYQWGRSGRLEEIIRTERIQSFSTHWSYLPAVCLSESRDEDITQPAGRARLAAVGVFRKLSRALESRATPPPWLLGLTIARSCAKRPTSVAGLA